jgi:hypothetical protein
MRQDFILDFETFGQSVFKCPVIDVSYTVFSWDRFLDNPYSFEELLDIMQKNKLSVEDQVKNYSCSFSQEDMKFWAQQSKEVQKNIAPTKNDLTLKQFFDKFIVYLRDSGKIEYWWSRSNTFDPIILDRLANADGRHLLMYEYIKYWRIRDIRSFIDAKFNWTTRNGFVPVADEQYWNDNFAAHDSRHDVAADILRLQAIHRAENDYEQVEK